MTFLTELGRKHQNSLGTKEVPKQPSKSWERKTKQQSNKAGDNALPGFRPHYKAARNKTWY